MLGDQNKGESELTCIPSTLRLDCLERKATDGYTA